MNYEAELKAAQYAATKAGQYLAKEFKKFQRASATHKTRHELVTKCDKQAEQIIFKTLKKYFPKINFLSEEAGANNQSSEYLWIIDPLDGTNNFTIHNPLFTVAIALLHRDELVMSVIYMPILKEIYWATLKGAYKNGKKMSVSTHSKTKDSFICYCNGGSLSDNKKALSVYGYYRQHSHDCRHFGSTSLELAMVASGHVDALVVSGPKIWDVAPGIMLVKAAGGTVTDWQGKPWHKNSKSVVASNKVLNTEIIKELKKLKVA